MPKSPPFNQAKIQLIDTEVEELLLKRAVTRVAPCKEEFISNIFLVPQKTGDHDMRPVINLKPLNQCTQNIHFKMENIQMDLNLISPGDFMVSLDLKDAYFKYSYF